MSSTMVTTMTAIPDVLTWEIQDLDSCLFWNGATLPGIEKILIDSVRSDPMEVAKGSSLHSKWVFQLASHQGHLALGAHLHDVLAKPPFEYDPYMDAVFILCSYDISLSSGMGQNLFATAKQPRQAHGFDPEKSPYGGDNRKGYYTYTNIMPIQDFVDNRVELCPGNKLVVQIAFTTLFDTKHEHLPSLKVENIAKKIVKDSLAKSLHRLLTDDSCAEFSDFKIICGDPAVTFNVHKAILAARSPFFETYFATRWNNSSTNRNEYRDEGCEPETFNSLLKFIYAAELDLPQATEKEALLRLIDGAEKFQLEELKTACFYQMFTNITDENAGEIAVAALHYNANEDCKKLIRNYCARRHEHLIGEPNYKKLFKSKPDAFLGIK